MLKIASQHKSNMIAKASDSSVMGLTGHQEGWTECFQDLETWCPPLQDELNTPQVTADGFNFGTFGQVKVLDDWYPVDLMAESLDSDMVKLNTSGFGLNEENNNNTSPYLKLPQTSSAINGIGVNGGGSGKSQSTFSSYSKSPLKSTSANILLSQSALLDFNPYKKLEDKFKTEMDVKSFANGGGGAPYDIAEDEENFVLVPPETVARKSRDVRIRMPYKGSATLKQEKPKLKLEIITPTAPSAVVMPSTPEVQNVLNEPKVGFDLIKYVVSGDYINDGTVSGATSNSNAYFQESAVTSDHDYVDVGLRCSEPDEELPFSIKVEPLSPGPLPIFEPVIRTDTIQKPERTRAVKRRSDSNSDYIFESDACTSDDSADWNPLKSVEPTKRRQTKKKQKTDNKISTKFELSDTESIGNSTVSDKYRELRDKNNEASRRSRLNRKQRDTEMRKAAEKLESENRALRARADRMSKLVLDMREIIMRTVKAANKKR